MGGLSHIRFVPNCQKLFASWALLLLLLCCRQAPDPDFQKALVYANQYRLYQKAAVAEGLLMARQFVHDSLSNPGARRLLLWTLNAHYHKAGRNYLQWRLNLDSAIAFIENKNLQEPLHQWLVMLYASRATTFYDLGLSAAAVDDLQKAKRLADAHQALGAQSEVNYYLGMVAYKEGRYAQAARHFQGALRHADRAKPDAILRTFYTAELLDNLGLCYYQLGEDSLAMQQYRATMAYLRNHAHNMGETPRRSANRFHNHMANVLENMGNLERLNNHLPAGLHYYRQGLRHAHSSEEPDSFLLGRLHNRLGRTALLQGLLPEARMQLDSSLRFGPARPGLDLYVLQLKAGVLWNWRTQNLDLALEYQARLDSAERAQRMAQTRLMQADLGNTLQQKEQHFVIAQLQQRKQAQTQMLWIMGICLTLGIGALWIVWRQARRNRRLLRAEQVLLQQLRDQKQALEQTARDKEKLMRVVAHDLRTPVGGIASSLELMQPELSLTAHNAELYQLCIDSAQQCMQMISEMVKEQAIAALPLTPVVLNELVRHSLLLLQPKALQKGVALVNELPAATLTVNASPLHLSRVLENLVHNAIKFSHAGQPVTVSVHTRQQQAWLHVADQGVGMSEQQLARLFQGSGTVGTGGEASHGLGLAICKQLIGQMGGQLSVQSRPGSGTVVSVQLALTAGEMAG